ncbi:MAG: hypothetical protein JWR63_1063 [Conexibacter sp.]|nr:hypothetical protein [Conexibacter sp.]
MWRVVVEVETEGSGGRRSMRLDLPRGDFGLADLHELARGAAEAANVLTEESTAVDVRVSFPDDQDAGSRALEAVLRARLEAWYRRVRASAPPR